MNSLRLPLQPLQGLKLSLPQLQRRIRALDAITGHLSESGTLDGPDHLSDLRESLRRCRKIDGDFADFTKVRRRESRLLSLYLMDLGEKSSRELLPAFDQGVAASILGQGYLKKHIRTQATQLYFAHYGTERIKALTWLAERLLESWRSEAEDRLPDDTAKSYKRCADLLFGPEAPAAIAKKYLPTESFDQFAERFGIPSGGEFRERLLEEVILERVRRAPSEGTGDTLDRLVQETKARRLRSGYPLGAEAVKILIDRSISTFKSKVPPGWKEQIVAYACDPRVPSSAEQTLWWGWASQQQKDVAIRSLTELTLRKFIELLETSLHGTPAETQFEKRANMLLRIFELGKVIDARLVVHESTYHTLPYQTRLALMPFQTSGGSQHTSFVVLKCTDDLFLIEGTHSFTLRGFIGSDRFPVPEIWSSGTGTYFHDRKFRVRENKCDIYQRHQGDWLWAFRYRLRWHHIEWHEL